MKWITIFLFPLITLCAIETPSEALPEKSLQVTEQEAVPQDDSLSRLTTDSYKKQFYRTFLLFLFFVGGAFIFIWFIRKYAQNRPFQINQKKNIKILERRQISPNTFLYHLEIGNKQVIIAESKYEIKVVANLDWEDPSPSN